MPSKPLNTTYRKVLAEISQIILQEKDDFLSLTDALTKLKQVFRELSDTDLDTDTFRNDLFQNTGKAIGAKWAEMCIQDVLRTKRFMKGVYLAVNDILATHPNKTVELLYIGTGPYATLITPLLPHFSPQQLQLTLVEINPNTRQILEKTMEKLGAEPYITKIMGDDGATMQLTAGYSPDIVLLECLQQALDKEQQVAITYNLIPQMKPNVILIPEQIQLQLCFINSAQRIENMMAESNIADNGYYMTDILFTLNKENTLSHTNYIKGIPVFEPVTSTIPANTGSQYNLLSIATHITTYRDQKIEIDQSSLTIPFKLTTLAPQNEAHTVVTRYEISGTPGIRLL